MCLDITLNYLGEFYYPIHSTEVDSELRRVYFQESLYNIIRFTFLGTPRLQLLLHNNGNP